MCQKTKALVKKNTNEGINFSGAVGGCNGGWVKRTRLNTLNSRKAAQLVGVMGEGEVGWKCSVSGI